MDTLIIVMSWLFSQDTVVLTYHKNHLQLYSQLQHEEYTLKIYDSECTEELFCTEVRSNDFVHFVAERKKYLFFLNGRDGTTTVAGTFYFKDLREH